MESTTRWPLLTLALSLLVSSCATGGPTTEAHPSDSHALDVVELIQDLSPETKLLRIEAETLEGPGAKSCPEVHPIDLRLAWRQGSAGPEVARTLRVECAWQTKGALVPAAVLAHDGPEGPVVERAPRDPRDASALAKSGERRSGDSAGVAGRMQPAVLVSRVEPEIPAALHTQPLTYFVNVCVRTDGTVGRVRIKTEHHHPVVDASVLDAVRRWKFEPFRLGGNPIPRCTPMALRL